MQLNNKYYYKQQGDLIFITNFNLTTHDFAN